jgi:RecA/RadA recombinase
MANAVVGFLRNIIDVHFGGGDTFVILHITAKTQADGPAGPPPESPDLATATILVEGFSSQNMLFQIKIPPIGGPEIVEGTVSPEMLAFYQVYSYTPLSQTISQSIPPAEGSTQWVVDIPMGVGAMFPPGVIPPNPFASQGAAQSWISNFRAAWPGWAAVPIEILEIDGSSEGFAYSNKTYKFMVFINVALIEAFSESNPITITVTTDDGQPDEHGFSATHTAYLSVGNLAFPRYGSGASAGQPGDPMPNFFNGVVDSHERSFYRNNDNPFVSETTNFEVDLHAMTVTGDT